MVAILDRDPPPLSEAPLLQSIVNKCLCKETNERYRTAGELLADLQNVREELNGRSSQTNLPLTEARSTARFSHRFVWTFIGAVMLLVTTIAGTLLYRRAASLRQSGPFTALEATANPGKPYLQMSERERLDFVAAQEHRISAMMSDRPVKLNDFAVRAIKAYVDRYADYINRTPRSGSENVSAVFLRAPPYVPLIARSFAARKVPIIIGIYLPVIESGYRSCYESGFGAKGLYQFMPQTAQNYGVSRRDMCDVEKMTPAAAHYIADRMAELGEDSESVTLVLLSYNRGAEWVRDTLRQLRGTENYERNFWTLLANTETLDEIFRNENAGYVPSFFAAAIVGENPEAFGLPIPPLSSLAGADAKAH